MSKLKEFNLKDYNTGQYTVETFDGQTVEIIAVDQLRDTMFGFYGGNNPTTWDIEGKYFSQLDKVDDRDLYLRPKQVVVHVNITRNKNGKIDCYASTAGRPRVYTGSTLLKYLTVEIDD